jgi:hypothetical protein
MRAAPYVRWDAVVAVFLFGLVIGYILGMGV